MEHKGKYSYALKIYKSVYFQNGQEFPVETPYLYFEQNGNVTLEGSDSNGSFSFSGHAENDYLFLKKQYHGKHAVYYVGKLEKNKLNLAYDFTGNYNELKEKVDKHEYMALMEFDSTLYNLFLEGENGKDQNIFLSQNDEKYKGLGIINDRLTKVVMKKKDHNNRKIKLNNGIEDKTIKTKIDESANNLYLEVNDNVRYFLRFFRSVYTMEGNEYTTFLPGFFFQGDGTFALDSQDNNGIFLLKGHVKDEYFLFEKNYQGKLVVYFAGKFDNDRLKYVYDFQGDYSNLMQNLNCGQNMGYIESGHKQYQLFLNGTDGKIEYAFLKQDGKKYKGFGLIDNKLYIVVSKLKNEEKNKYKFKVKGNSEVRMMKARLEGNNFIVKSI